MKQLLHHRSSRKIVAGDGHKIFSCELNEIGVRVKG